MLIGISYHWCCLLFDILSLSHRIACTFSLTGAHFFSLTIFTKFYSRSRFGICALTANRCTTIFQNIWEGLCALVYMCICSSFLIIYFIFSFCALFSRHRIIDCLLACCCCCVHKKIEFFFALCNVLLAHIYRVFFFQLSSRIYVYYVKVFLV